MTNYQFTGGTICAPATIPGTGAISIIRVSGKEALAIADKVIDTAGIRETDKTIEKIGIDRTFKKLGEAAVVLGMTDLSRGEAAVLEDADFILSKVNEMSGVKNFSAGSDGAETGGASLAETGGASLVGTDGTSLAETGGTSLAETGGTPLSETDGTPLAETGGASQHGHGAEQERKVVILVNKCDVAGDFYRDDNGTGYGSGNDLGKNMAEIGGNKNVNHDNNIVSLIENKYDNCKVIPISAKTGKGLSTLTKTLGEIGSEITGSTDETLGNIFRNFCHKSASVQDTSSEEQSSPMLA